MPLSVEASTGVLDNDTDADGDSLTAVVMSDPSNGTLAINADGSFTYTPNAGYNGIDPLTIVYNHLNQPRELVKAESVSALFA